MMEELDLCIADWWFSWVCFDEPQEMQSSETLQQ
jgi:hypothetical protein